MAASSHLGAGIGKPPWDSISVPEIQKINRALGDIRVELAGAPRTANHFLINGNPILVTPRPCLRRVFLRDSWRCGGNRLGTYRDQILLNSYPVARPDYCALYGCFTRNTALKMKVAAEPGPSCLRAYDSTIIATMLASSANPRAASKSR
jgi:hypothetical protein